MQGLSKATLKTQKRGQGWIQSPKDPLKKEPLTPPLDFASRFSLEPEVKWSESRSVVSDSLRPHGLYSSWNSPGQNTGVGSLSLLQGIFPTQGLNPGLPHCRRILYQLSHKESPRIMEWVAYPFSRASSWCRNQTRVSCIAGRFFTNWAIWEACNKPMSFLKLTSNSI